MLLSIYQEFIISHLPEGCNPNIIAFMLIILYLRMNNIPHAAFIHISEYPYRMFMRRRITRFIPIYYFMEMHKTIPLFI